MTRNRFFRTTTTRTLNKLPVFYHKVIILVPWYISLTVLYGIQNYGFCHHLWYVFVLLTSS